MRYAVIKGNTGSDGWDETRSRRASFIGTEAECEAWLLSRGWHKGCGGWFKDLKWQQGDFYEIEEKS